MSSFGWSRHETTSRPSGQAGFTLVELMISLSVVSIAIAAAFTMAISLMNGFRGNRSVVQVESTARTVLDIIATGVRSASPGLVNGIVFDTCQGADVATIEVTNFSNAPDQLRVIHALGGALASTTANHDIITDGTLNVDDNASFDKDLFMPAVIIDPLNGKGHLLEIKALSGSSTSIQTRIQPGACPSPSNGAEDYLAGSLIVPAVQMVYRLNPPFLLVDPDGPGPKGELTVAEGIEDMQIAVGVENGTDDTTLPNSGLLADDDEWHFNHSADVAPPAGAIVCTGSCVDGGNWRALRITIVGYGVREQDLVNDSLRPAAEDRPAALASDSMRRRTFSTTVGLRNFSAGN